MRIMTTILAGVALVNCLGSPAAAQEAAATVQSFEACRAIKDDGQRLACFDRAAAGFSASVAKKDVVILDRGEVRRTKRSLFGFSLPKLPFFGNDERGKEEKPEFTEIDSVVKSVQSLGYDKYAVTIDDGAVWQNTEPMGRTPRSGDKVHVKQGMVTNYFMRIGTGRLVRAVRVR